MKKRNLHLLQKRFERKNKRAKKKRKILNIRRNFRFKGRYVEKKSNSRYRHRNTVIILTSPSNFSLIDNTEEVIGYINTIDTTKKKRHIKYIQINLNDVINIEICAISLLLTKINELMSSKIYWTCNLPKNENCRDIIASSGFLDRMKEVQSGKQHKRNNKNLMIARGFDKTDNKATGEMIKKVTEHLTSIPNLKYQPLYSIIQEICANSIEHANNSIPDKNWLLATNFKDKEVEFTLTDIGEGIIKTIKKKKIDEFRETTGFIEPQEILRKSFEKIYQSRTFDINRNKGLPRIYEVSNQNYILDMIVITNNVLCDFKNPENTKTLKINFNGTFYFWKLTKNCIEKWENRKKQYL